MAYRPSRRQTQRSPEALEPNMAPIMNLMVVLIPLLLSSVQLIKISMIEINLPPATSNEALTKKQDTSRPVRLDLSITITDKGFYLAGAAPLIAKQHGKLLVPKKQDTFDYEQLAKQLLAIKTALQEDYPDANSVTIQAEPQIDYQTLVSTMDAARSTRVDGQLVTLFPNASMSALML